MLFRHRAQVDPQCTDVFPRQAIGNETPITLRHHQPRRLQHFEMRARQFDVDASVNCQGFDGFFALRQNLQQFQSLGTGNRFTDAGHFFVEQVFGFSLVHKTHIPTNIRI